MIIFIFLSIKTIGSLISTGVNGNFTGFLESINKLSKAQQLLVANSVQLNSAQAKVLSERIGASVVYDQETGAVVRLVSAKKAEMTATAGATSATATHTGVQAGATTATNAQTIATHGLNNALTGTLALLKSTAIALVTNPLTWIVGGLAVAMGLLIHEATKFDKAIEKATESQSAYAEIAQELQSLQSEFDTTKEKIEELQALADSGEITLSQENELNNLKLQNAELERKIKLKQKDIDTKAETAINDAMTAFNMQRTNDLTQSTGSVVDDFGVRYDTYAQTDIVTATQNELKALQGFYDQKRALLDEYNNAESEARKDEINAELNSIETEIAKYSNKISDQVNTINTLRENLVGKDNLTFEQSKILEDTTNIIDDWNNIDLSKADRELAQLERYFSSSKGKNIIKKRLSEASDSTEDLEKALSKMGLSLNDIGVESIETLQRYLKETTFSTQEASKAIAEFDGSLSSVKTAFDTKNQDSTWLSMTEFISSAKELYDAGQVGTDDFKSVAQMISASPIDVDNEKYKYDADAYVEAWNNAYSEVKSWFIADDQEGSARNFAESLKGADLATYDSTDGYTWQFKSSAEAADKLGQNIEIVEAAMRNLMVHGAEFGDVVFSGEQLSDYEYALNGIRNIYDSMSDGLSKDALGEMLKNWDSEYANIQDDLSSLTEEQIIKIKFEYDLATLRQEIDVFQNKWNQGDRSAETGASLNATKEQYREQREKSTGYDENTEDAGYKASYAQIDNLQSQFGTEGADVESIQSQISAIYDMQNAFQDALDNGFDADWEEFLGTRDAQKVMNELVKQAGLTSDELATLFGVSQESLQPDPVKIEFRGEFDQNELQREIDSMDTNTTITFDATVDGVESEVNVIKNLDGTVIYTAEVDGIPREVEPIKHQDGSVTYHLVGQDPAQDSEAGVNYYNASQDAPDNQNAGVDYYKKSQEAPEEKEVGLVYRIKGVIGSISNFISGIGGISGTAHQSGTAYESGTLDDTKWLKARWKTKTSNMALTGERGQEIVVDPKTNTWRTVGDNGAEFAHIPKGAVVFNAEQTKKLLSRGYIHSRGRALLNGTAYDTTQANGWRPPSSNTGFSGTGTSNNSKSNNSNNNNDNNNGDSKSAEKLDWIAVLLSRIQRVITNFSKTATSTFKSWTERTTALESQISSTKQEMEYQKQGADRYLKEAESIDLSYEYKQKVQNGTIDIESIEDETVRENIQNYQKWYELFLDCSDASQELEQNLADLERQQFDNIAKQFEDRLAEIEHETSILDSLIEQTEAKGYVVGKSFYEAQIENEYKTIETLKQERTALQKQLAESGFEVGTEEWNSMNQEIMDITQSIEDSELKVIEYQNAIDNLDFESFEYLNELISKITTESDLMIEMMSDAKKFDSETGAITDEGLATLALHRQNSDIYTHMADGYADIVADLDEQLKLDPYDKDLRQQRDEYWAKELEYREKAKSEDQKRIDIISEGYDLFLEKTKELVDKQKEQLKNTKDLYDYEKSVRESVEEIQTLEKRLQAYSGDTSEENRVYIQQTEAQLKEARENLEETQYDRYIQDQEKLLDTLVLDIETWVDERLQHQDELLAQNNILLDEKSKEIAETIDREAGEIGLALSKEMSSIWDTENGTYGKNINDTLSSIEDYIAELLKDAEKRAEDEQKKQDEDEKESVPIPQENNTTPSNNDTQNDNQPQEDNKSSDITIGSTIDATGAKIYARAGGTGYNQYFSDDPIYTVIGEEGDYVRVRWHKASSGSTGWFKKSDIKGYSNGGWIDETGLFMGHGSTSKPEAVLDAKDSQNLVDLTDILREMDSPILSNRINNPLSSPMYQLPKGTSGAGINSVVHFDNIVMNNVNDPNAFMHNLHNAFAYDRKTQNMVNEIALGSVLSGNPYSVRKYL